MLWINFPIMDPLRKYLILMEWILVFVSLELSLIFLIKYINSRRTRGNIQELSYSILIFSFGLQWIWFIISDFYAPNAQARIIFLNLGYVSLLLGATFFVYIMERSVILIHKYIFTYIFILLNILYFLFLFIAIDFTQTFIAAPWPFFIIFFALYFIDLSKKASKSIPYGIVFVKFFSGFVLLGIGYTLTIDVVTSIFGLTARFIGDLIMIVGIFIIYLFFSSLPPLSEFDWQKNLRSIFLIDPSGLPIFSKMVVQQKDKSFETLISGALTSIRIILKDITKNEGLSVVKMKDNVTIIYPGKHLIGVIITKEELNSLKFLLKKFVHKVEDIYADSLSEWNRDLSVFKPISKIYETIFKKD